MMSQTETDETATGSSSVTESEEDDSNIQDIGSTDDLSDLTGSGSTTTETGTEEEDDEDEEGEEATKVKKDGELMDDPLTHIPIPGKKPSGKCSGLMVFVIVLVSFVVLVGVFVMIVAGALYVFGGLASSETKRMYLTEFDESTKEFIQSIEVLVQVENVEDAKSWGSQYSSEQNGGKLVSVAFVAEGDLAETSLEGNARCLCEDGSEEHVALGRMTMWMPVEDRITLLGLRDDLEDKIEEELDKIKEKVQEKLDQLEEWYHQELEKLKDALGNIEDKLKDELDKLKEKKNSDIEKERARIIDKYNEAKKKIQDKIDKLEEEFKKKYKDAKDSKTTSLCNEEVESKGKTLLRSEFSDIGLSFGDRISNMDHYNPNL